MMPNMSALPDNSTVSTDRPTGMPASRNFAVCGKPKPMRNSVNGEMLMLAPASATRLDLVRRRFVGVDDLHVVA